MKTFIEIEESDLDALWLLVSDLSDAGVAQGLAITSILTRSIMWDECEHEKMLRYMTDLEKEIRTKAAGMGIKLKDPLDAVADKFQIMRDDIRDLDLIEHIRAAAKGEA